MKTIKAKPSKLPDRPIPTTQDSIEQILKEYPQTSQRQELFLVVDVLYQVHRANQFTDKRFKYPFDAMDKTELSKNVIVAYYSTLCDHAFIEGIAFQRYSEEDLKKYVRKQWQGIAWREVGCDNPYDLLGVMHDPQTRIYPALQPLHQKLSMKYKIDQTPLRPEKFTLGYTDNSDVVELNMAGLSPLSFEGRRGAILKELFLHRHDQQWRTHKEMTVPEQYSPSASNIGKGIDKINERFKKHTRGKYRKIIEKEKGGDGLKIANKYRWKLWLT